MLEPGAHFLTASVTGQREMPIEVSPFFAVIDCLDIAPRLHKLEGDAVLLQRADNIRKT
jgi:hypothetical protein